MHRLVKWIHTSGHIMEDNANPNLYGIIENGILRAMGTIK